jgi:hypothetical protein
MVIDNHAKIDSLSSKRKKITRALSFVLYGVKA